MDPETGSETTNPTGETETQGDTETTGVVPMDADYRLNSLGVLDPPLSLNGIPANDLAGNELTGALTADDDAD